MSEPDFGGNVLREYTEHVDAISKGLKSRPHRAIVIEFMAGDELPNLEFFGQPEQSREESISLLGEALMALGAAIQAVNADGAH